VNVICTALIFLGLFFFFAGTVGILRLPDFYTRLHAAGKCDSLAAVLIIVGVALYTLQDYSFASLLVALKIVLIAVFVFIANPTATHAITEAALILGVKPWERSEREKP
jgi:multicomponent Na+:H+ antiporter subunit G